MYARTWWCWRVVVLESVCGAYFCRRPCRGCHPSHRRWHGHLHRRLCSSVVNAVVFAVAAVVPDSWSDAGDDLFAKQNKASSIFRGGCINDSGMVYLPSLTWRTVLMQYFGV